jgi:hypothetical protein
MVITFKKSWDLYQWLSWTCANVKELSKMNKKKDVCFQFNFVGFL